MSRSFARPVLCVLAGSMLACQDTAAPAAPLLAEEAVSAGFTSRIDEAFRDPPFPTSIRMLAVSGGDGTVRISVVRPSPPFCVVRIAAHVERSDRVLAIVVRMMGDPAINCAALPGEMEYHATVPRVAPGRYRVRVFESVGSASTTFVGTRDAEVAGGAS